MVILEITPVEGSFGEFGELAHRVLQKNIASIDKILDRYDNARNEHISKIRYAFVTQFSEDIAKDYIITRNDKGLLKINISPDLIRWE